MPKTKLNALKTHLTQTILGSQEPATLLLVALLAKGHALIEGPPGIGKTSLAQTLADAISSTFKRIQFTPDLLPSDILGYHLYRQHNGEFDFIPGPIFANLLLADEINRTSPRVQSALLEAMNEGQVTIDGSTHDLTQPFLVIATQNDTTSTGTFPLPEPQLDRFLLSIPMSLPDRSTQEAILNLHLTESNNKEINGNHLTPQDILELQEQTKKIHISPSLSTYIIDLCEQTRKLAGGPHTLSVRASLALLRATQAQALLQDSDHATPDHVQDIFHHVMRHRLISDDGSDPQDILTTTLQQTPMA